MSLKLKWISFVRGAVLMGTLTFLTGCLSQKQMRAQEIQADLALREMRSLIEDQKYQLSRLEVELQIVEGKSDVQASSIQQIREERAHFNQEERVAQNQPDLTKDSLERLEKSQDCLRRDMQTLQEQTQEIYASLSQFKNKIDVHEEQVLEQTRWIDHLKESLEALLKRTDQPSVGSLFYVVQAGDTLEKIAGENEVAVDEIKELNHLHSPLIVIGQKLRLK